MELTERIKELEEKLRFLEYENKQLQTNSAIANPQYYLPFQDLFFNMRIPCVIYTAIDDGEDFRIHDLNSSFERMEGINRSEMIGKRVSSVLKNVGPEFLQALQRVYRNGKMENFVFQFINKKKELNWRDNDIFKLSSGEVISIYDDVSPLKKKERELMNSEARYKNLADATNEAIFFLEDAHCVDANKTAIRMFGYSLEEMKGMFALSIIDESYHEETINNLKNNFTKPYTSMGVHKDGRRFPIRIHGRTFIYNGKQTRITTMLDISAEKEKERALLNSETRFRALAEATTEAVLIMENGKCIDQNKRASEIFGYSSSEAIGIDILDLVAPQSKDLVRQKTTLDYAEPYEGWCVRKNGEVFPAELRGKNFDYDGRRVRISTIRDISTQKQAEKKLAISEAKFRAYFEDHHAIKIQFDAATTQIIDANKSAQNFYGYSKEELVSMKVFDLNALSREELALLIKKALAKTQNVFSFPHRLKNGQIRDVQVFVSPIEVDGRTTMFSIIHDITEGKKAEEELRKSEARFRSYFENNTAVMLQIDPQSKRIVNANNAALKFYGYEESKMKTLTAYDINILSPDEIDRSMNEVMISPANKTIFKHRLASGECREGEVFVSPIIVENEQQLFLSVYDVSDREANKRALEESERVLKEAQSIAKIGNWEYNFETEEMFWSDETYKIFETNTSYFLNEESYNQLIHPDDLDTLIKNYALSVKNKEPYYSIHRILLPKGKIKYVEEKGYTIYREDGKPLRSVGTTQDITEQELAKMQLKKSQTYLNQAQHMAKVGHFEFDMLTQTTVWSAELCRIYGFDIEDNHPNYERYRSRIHPEDLAYADKMYQEALEEKRSYSIIFRIYSMTGELKYIEAKGDFVYDSQENPIGILGTVQDITSSYLIQKDLEDSKAQLALINQNLEEKVKAALTLSREKDHMLIQQSRHAVLGEMIGNIAHQWRQPLNEISVLINDLEDAFSFGVLTKEYFDKTIEIVYRRLKYMSDTISDFSSMHTDDFKKEVFHPKALIEKLIQFAGGSIEKNNILIHFKCENDFEVFGYPNMLSHVLLNLLNNSRDILLERKIQKPTIWINLEQKNESYYIRVLDNGEGIETKLIDKIFDPYFTTKGSTKGSGLGLYMAKSMLEKQMNGKIEVKNQPDGAEFIITLDVQIKDLW